MTGNRARVLTLKDVVVVRRADGFWRVSVTRTTECGYAFDWVWAAPLSKTPVLSSPARMPVASTPVQSSSPTPRAESDNDPAGNAGNCNDIWGGQAAQLLFVGPDFVAEEWEEPGRWPGYPIGLLPYDDLQRGQPIDIARYFGSDAVRLLKDAATAAAAREYGPESEPDSVNWSIVRRPGRWGLRGRAHVSCPDACAKVSLTDFTIPLDPPAALVGHDRLVPAWKAIKGQVSEATDAFASPTGDFVVVLTRIALRVFAVRAGGIGHELLQTSAEPGESAVAIQWVTGPEVEQWTRELGTILKP